MPMKIAIIGAGSVVFGKHVIADILCHDAFRDCELHLVDIDSERLDTAAAMACAINRELGTAATVSPSRDRLRALEGADFVINMINVGGMQATRNDLLVPQQFGLRQTIGDSLGVGGIFRAARSIPALLEIAGEMKRLCPRALLINYTNPMAMNMLALQRASDIPCVGICHGLKYTAATLRTFVHLYDNGIPEDAINAMMDRTQGIDGEAQWHKWIREAEDPDLHYVVAGINHMAFFLSLKSGNRDLYPSIWKASTNPALRRLDSVRFELFERLGYFMTETTRHTAEYVPWIMRHDSEIKRFELRPHSYLDVCDQQQNEYLAMQAALKRGETVVGSAYRVSNEHVSRIVNAVATGQPYVFNGNVHNAGGAVVTNLPGDSCVEVPCVADRNGVQTAFCGELPPQCAALIRSNISVQDLAVKGILEQNRTHIRHALMMDPNTAATLTLPQIDQLCDHMFEAHKETLQW